MQATTGSMERKKESQEFASIDENPVTSRSIDTNLARQNLQRLQDHVNRQFSNVVSSSPCAGRVIGSDTSQHHPRAAYSDALQHHPRAANSDTSQRHPRAASSDTSQYHPRAANSDTSQYHPRAANSGASQRHPMATNSDTSQYHPRAAGSDTSQHQQQMSYISSSGLDIFPRPPSINNDDDLFKGESDSNHSGENDPEPEIKLADENVENNDNSATADGNSIERTESGFESPGADAIPDFVAIGISFTSRSSKGSDAEVSPTDKSKDRPGEDKEFRVNEVEFENDNIKTEDAGVGEKNLEMNVEFRAQDRGTPVYRRSQSDIKDKRKRFSQRDDFVFEEIPVFDEDSHVPVRKSNSLPDLILSLSSSNSSPRSGSDKQSPDVVFRGHQDYSVENVADIQRDRKTLKDSFEGKSSFEKPDIGEIDNKKRKPSFRRSVSFNEKTDYRYFHEGEPAVSPGVFDESVENPLHDNMHTAFRKENDDGDKVQKKRNADNELQSPKSVEGRRQLFSKSSGYQTGSDQSRESHDTQNESFDKTFNENRGPIGVDEVQNSPKTDSGKSDTSNSSQDTILEQIIYESNRHEEDVRSASSGEQTEQRNEKSIIPDPSPELPFLSIMEKSPESSLGNYVVQKKSLDNDNNDIASGTLGDNNVENAHTGNEPIQDHLKMNQIQSALDFRRSQSTLGSSMPGTLPTGSLGNLPKLDNILDDRSYLVGPSMLEKVDEVDNQHEECVKRKYLGGNDAAIGRNGPTALGNDETALSRYSLSSYQQIPKSLTIQEFERILIANVEPEKVTAAIHKLLGSSSSSPGHSPLEYGDGRYRANSPINKLFTVEDLERASRCTHTTCPEKACEKMRQVQMLLSLDIEESHTLTNLMLMQYLEALYLHSESCDEIMCPVLYCHMCYERCDQRRFNPHQLLADIRMYIKNPLSLLKQQSKPRFIKLHDNVSDRVPEQFITYIPLCNLDQSGKMLLIQDLQLQTLCVLKQYPLFEDNHQSRALEKLCNLDHPHLVIQLWMSEFTDESIQICSQFMQGGSLQEYLHVSVKLPWLQAADYLKQLTDAVCFLQERRVVFLNWQSKNMLFPDTRRETIKLCDFGLSHCLGGEADVGALKQCLPVYLWPPELLHDNTVHEKSDCWGLACLLAEMLTGTPLWYDLRHEDRDTVQKKISGNMIPYVEKPPTDQEIIYKNCWQLNPDQRCSIKKLDQYLSKVLSKR